MTSGWDRDAVELQRARDELCSDPEPWWVHHVLPYLAPVIMLALVSMAWLVPAAVRLGELAGHWAWPLL